MVTVLFLAAFASGDFELVFVRLLSMRRYMHAFLCVITIFSMLGGSTPGGFAQGTSMSDNYVFVASDLIFVIDVSSTLGDDEVVRALQFSADLTTALASETVDLR